MERLGMTLQEIAEGLHARKSGSGYCASCPCHEDKTPSLHLTEKNGKILVHCFSCQNQAAVIAKLRELNLWIARPRLSREDWIRVQKLKAAVEHLDGVKELALESDNIPRLAEAARAQVSAQRQLEALGVSTRQREREVSEQVRERVREYMQAQRNLSRQGRVVSLPAVVPCPESFK